MNDVEADYGHLNLMESITITALELLPKKQKRRKENLYKDPNIESLLWHITQLHLSLPKRGCQETAG